jgi:hypothetical protein
MEQIQVKWIDGVYRGVSIEDAALDAKIVKALFRQGEKLRSEGVLAAYVNQRLDNEKFQASIGRLAEHKFIEISGALHGSARRIKLLAEDVAAKLSGRDLAPQADWFVTEAGHRTPTAREMANEAEALGLKKPVTRVAFLAAKAKATTE